MRTLRGNPAYGEGKEGGEEREGGGERKEKEEKEKEESSTLQAHVVNQ